MTRQQLLSLLAVGLLLLFSVDAIAIGPRGGGGRGGGISAGGGRGGFSGISRPSIPSISRPSPSIRLPSTGGVSMPSMPGLPSIPSVPSLGTGNSHPNFGPRTRPSTLPGTDRPFVSSSIPSARPLPSTPSMGARPSQGGLPGRDSSSRPKVQDVGDFLNMPRPATHDFPAPEQRPAGGQRPGIEQPIANLRPGTGEVPGMGGAIVNRPGPSMPIRPAVPDRPGGSTRPNLTPDRIAGINDGWQSAINRPSTLPAPNPRWDKWGDSIRDNIQNRPNRPWYGDNWWQDHANNNWWWSAGYGRYAWTYWWTYPTWGAFTTWCGGTWGEPYYYDYGTNVLYQGDNVYINGEQVASGAEYAETASQVASTPPPAAEEAQEATEWLALGVFALSSSESETQPSRILQLSVSREGLIAGTYYNTATDSTQPIQGAVDRKTQRACWTLGDNKNVVFDTGIYNLTKDETPVLVHFGSDKTDSYLLARLTQPESASGETPTP